MLNEMLKNVNDYSIEKQSDRWLTQSDDTVRRLSDVVRNPIDNSFNPMIHERNLMDSFAIEDTSGSI